MTSKQKPISRAHLHAYVDRELSQQRHADVEGFLQTHPDLTRQVREYAEINHKLHRLFDNVMNEPVPGPLCNKVRTAETANKTISDKSRRKPAGKKAAHAKPARFTSNDKPHRSGRFAIMHSKITIVLLGMILGGIIGITLHQSDSETLNHVRVLLTDLLTRFL
jgi:anti-sigma factor RsiW